MFRNVSRLSLRRCLHTPSARPTASGMRNSRVTLLAGASAAVATYATWKTFQGRNTIALDSATTTAKSAPLSPKASTTPETLATSHSTALQHEPSIHEPHTTEAQDTEESGPDAETTEGAEDEHEGAGGAFNPVTGEINWDCPCLGGMAHGICGAQFRDAFSCFVFSEKDPKGIDCVEKFKAMQDCFREHPDVYGEDIMDEDEDDDEALAASVDGPAPAPTAGTASPAPAHASISSQQPEAAQDNTPSHA